MADDKPYPTQRTTVLPPQSCSALKIKTFEVELKKYRFERLQMKATLETTEKELMVRLEKHRFEKAKMEANLETAREKLAIEKEERHKAETALEGLEREIEKHKKKPIRRNFFEHEREIKTKGYTEAFHESVESIFVSYADYTTVLLTIFIVLFAFSIESTERMQEVGSAISTSFQGQPTDDLINSGKDINVLQGNAAIQPPAESYENIKGEVEDSLKGLDLGDNVKVTTQKEGVVITLKDQITFSPGEAALLDSSVPVLKKIADILNKRADITVDVEGHTDNVPINTARFPSNWELSTLRASNVVRFFIESEEISAQRLSARGLAEYHPVTDNRTPEGRATNRRVEIKIRKTVAETRET